MSTGNNKLKLLYLMKFFQENSDEDHAVTMQDILEYLNGYGITAERKSLYADIETLRQFGIDIGGYKENRQYFYKLLSRDFETAELKLLVDSVQSSKFITAKKSNELIKKLENLSSKHQSSLLSREVIVAGRVKAINESILYNVDTLHLAISKKKKIAFSYFNWDVNKKPVLRHDGARYEVSPFAMCFDNENYYLVAYDTEASQIKHFRVDKMLDIEILNKRREGSADFKSFDMAAYARKTFGMWDGKEENVKLLCDNSMAGVIIDRFGLDTPFIKKGKEQFEAKIKVAVSKQFLSWVISLGGGVTITGPKAVVTMMKEEVKRLQKQYK